MDETQLLVRPLNGPSFHSYLAIPQPNVGDDIGHRLYFVITTTRSLE
jgi:hypothetical protein